MYLKLITTFNKCLIFNEKIFTFFSIIVIGCTQNQYKIDKGQIGKLIKENKVNQLDSIYNKDSIVRRIGEGDYMFSGDDKYLIYSSESEHLLTLTPRNQHDPKEPIETIEIISEKFKTSKGINIKSTFEIDKHHKINSIQNTITI